jgi:hypothetical protein
MKINSDIGDIFGREISKKSEEEDTIVSEIQEEFESISM